MLELTAAALDPQHARATNELLFAVKAWPGPSQRPPRERLLEGFRVDRALAEAEAVGGSVSLELARRAFRATGLQELRAETRQRMAYGLKVGQYFYEAVLGHLSGADFTLADLKHRRERLAERRAHPLFDFRKEKFRDIEREFRPAAALWAAHMCLKIEDEPPDLGTYLQVSECIADVLPQIHLKQHGPLLPKGTDLWRVPASVRASLPQVWMLTERVTPGTKLLKMLK